MVVVAEMMRFVECDREKENGANEVLRLLRLSKISHNPFGFMHRHSSQFKG